jgi:hypothetical protein
VQAQAQASSKASKTSKGNVVIPIVIITSKSIRLDDNILTIVYIYRIRYY